jgi:5-methylcytosine-specific restriction endonuclease McrBC GTP-binding regulatory subunit McrB
VNEEIPVQDVYEKLFSQQTIYKLNHSWIKKEFFTKGKKVRDARKHRNYVLIIDEINRGNISQIFGELITLIEKDKRKGGDERTQVVLPYSHESFSVPSNLFIIGTMNTADRSIEALDTALRRRFSFKEIAPDSSIIIQKGKSAAMGGIVENVNLAKLLDTINDRIEKLLDKDHRIGHSYFMKVHSLKELVDSFKDKIIPLLQEYFYGDFGKIGLVLGNAFVKIKNENDNDFSFAKFKGYDEDIMSDLKQRKIYEITTPENWTVQAFQSVYSDKNQE